MIGRTLGGYRIVEQVGMGGMATVFKAYDASTDRYVALKTLPEQYSKDPQFVERFRREAKAIAKLEHLHILPLFAYGEDDGVAYLAMRYLPAGTLSNHIKQRGQMPLDEAARILNQVASALDHAHANGVLHRDIKPSNVLIDKDANAYLTDFGIARMVEGTLDLTGDAILGTPQYMSPEQCQGRKDLTPASDQYSLGVVLYEMVTGRVPFQAETPLAVIIMQINGSELPRPGTLRPDLPEAAEAVIFKALARNPDDRYPSCEAMARAFAQAIGQSASTPATRSAAVSAPVTSRAAASSTVTRQAEDGPTVVQTPAPVSATAPSSQRFSPTLIGAGVVGLIVVIAAIAFLTRPSTTASITETPAPTQAAVVPSATSLPLTATPLVVPTETSIPATATTHIEQAGSPLIVATDAGKTQPSNTPVPPTATTQPSNTPIPPTATTQPSNTPVPPTATTKPSNTPVPPTATTKPSNTPVPPTATIKPSNTPIPPTATTAVISAQASGALPTEVAMLLTNGDSSTAIQQLTQAIEKAPEDGSLYLLRGQAYMQMGDANNALTDFAYAATFAPNLPDTYIQRAALYRSQDNNYAALDDLSAALKLLPDRADLYVMRGDTYRDLQDVDNAAADYQKAIELDPQNPKWYAARATANEWRGDLESAITDLNKALELDPKSGDYYAQRGSDYRWSDQYELAMADFRQAVTLAPENPLGYAGSVEVFIAALDIGTSLDNYDLDKALADANRAAELAPDNSTVFVDRGRVHAYRGEMNEAVNDYTQAIKVFDQTEAAYLYRGYAYTNLGEFEKAHADFNKAIELRSDNLDAYQGKIENFLEAYDNGKKLENYDLEAALNDANLALTLDENNGVTLLLRGKVYSRQGSLDNALADLNRTVELESGMAWGYQERGFILAAMNKTDEAIADFNKAIELDPGDTWSYVGLGDVLYDAGRKKDALTAYKTYADKAGDAAVDYVRERIAELEKSTK
jgi:serine/threonine-protein kinase